MLTRLGFFLGLAVLGGLLAPQLTLALGFGDFEVGVPGIQEKSIDEFVKKYEKDALIRFIDLVIKVVRGVVIAVGLIAVVVGGYQYMMAGGDSSKVAKAKVIIGGALFGIILAILGQVLLDTISPQFSGDVVEPTLKFPTSSPVSGAPTTTKTTPKATATPKTIFGPKGEKIEVPAASNPNSGPLFGPKGEKIR